MTNSGIIDRGKSGGQEPAGAHPGPCRRYREYRYGRIRGDALPPRWVWRTHENASPFSRQLRPCDARSHGYHRARGAAFFDRSSSPSCRNGEKTHPMFTDEEKLELMRVQRRTAGIPNVEAALWNGLLDGLCRAKGRSILVRGARAVWILNAEYQISLIYKDVSGGALDTVLFLTARAPAHVHRPWRARGFLMDAREPEYPPRRHLRGRHARYGRPLRADRRAPHDRKAHRH